MSDYLFDGSGRPDPEVEALERELSTLRREPPPLRELPARPAPRSTRWRPLVAFPLLLAASLVLAVALASLARKGSWTVTWQGGGGGASRLAPGEWLDTGARGAALTVGLIGTLQVEPGSRLRLVSTSRDEHRVALARGTIHALIWAPPRRFFVDTPVATAIDLGCAYTLTTAEDGDGLLRVTSGWVSFERRTPRGVDEVAVPAGASCRVLAATGPGVPLWDDAPEGFRRALEAHEAGGDGEAFASLLASARARDALTLLAMAPRLPAVGRGAVFDRLAVLSQEARRLSRERFVAGDPDAIEAMRSVLGLPVP